MLALRSYFFVIFLALALSACTIGAREPVAPEPVTPPVMRWDHVAQASEWTRTSFAALETHAAILPSLVPDDIGAWCPAYSGNTAEERAAFWVGLISALAEHESTWNPRAIGGGGRWFGLTQISPATARGYGCAARSGEALLNGNANLSCALRIWAVTVPRDGVVSAGRGGVAADWGPMVQTRKREDMRAWVSQQSYCQE